MQRKDAPTWLPAVLGLLAIIVITTAVAFSETFVTGRAVDNAGDLHWANATTGIGATARAAAGQAALLEAGHDLGFVDAAAVDASLEELAAQRTALASWIAEAPPSIDAAMRQSLTAYLAVVDDLFETIEVGATDQAAEILSGPFESAWRSLEMRLETVQHDAAERVAASEGTAALINLVMRLLLTLIVPLGAVAWYRLRARRQLATVRQEFEREIATRQKLSEAKNELIAGVSHELRTPLTTIYGFSDVLAKGGHGLEVTDQAQLIHAEARTLRRLIDDFLAATRLADGSLKLVMAPVDVSELVRQEAGPFRSEARIRVQLPNATVRADREGLGHIIRNLLANAVQHGGPHVQISGSVRGDRFLLVVSDDGEGIAPEDRSRAFEPFRHDGGEALTTGSVGLGLHVARGLSRAMSGDIEYARQEWTHFLVVLPLVALTDSPGKQPIRVVERTG